MSLTDEEKRKRHNRAQREYQKRTNYAANAKSNKKNTKMFSFRFSYSTDGDLIEFLDGLENRNGYLRGLIRADMAAVNREQGNRVIPFFGNSFAAGPGEPDFGLGLEEYEIPATQRGDFAVRINGDSMEPYLPDGSVQIGIRETPRDGDVVAIMVDGAFYVKQIAMSPFGDLYLKSLNRARRDMDVTVHASGNSTVRCFGTILMRERVPLPLD